jgi:hypothetical protein
VLFLVSPLLSTVLDDDAKTAKVQAAYDSTKKSWMNSEQESLRGRRTAAETAKQKQRKISRS